MDSANCPEEYQFILFIVVKLSEMITFQSNERVPMMNLFFDA